MKHEITTEVPNQRLTISWMLDEAETPKVFAELVHSPLRSDVLSSLQEQLNLFLDWNNLRPKDTRTYNIPVGDDMYPIELFCLDWYDIIITFRTDLYPFPLQKERT